MGNTITAYAILVSYAECPPETGKADLKKSFIIYTLKEDSVDYIKWGICEDRRRLMDSGFKRKSTNGKISEALEIIENLEDECKEKDWNLIHTTYMGPRMLADIIATHMERFYGNEMRFTFPLGRLEKDPD